ncbi:hypothetical protein ACF05L_02905 [Streptomyces bobili]|uniref:hypothetical protein n=1 Tax=Streptomyces bobili TaxID=67280 RepID=UPI0037025671
MTAQPKAIRTQVWTVTPVLRARAAYGVQGAAKCLVCAAQAESPGNLAYSPELWERMVQLGSLPQLSPAHLTWIDFAPSRSSSEE